jgi:hypothetical protein
MARHQLIFSFFLFLSLAVSAQDERYFRQILTGDLPGSTDSIKDTIVPGFNAYGMSYRLDLNGDGIEEIIQPQKRDGVDWVEIRDSSQRILLEAKLLAMGRDSTLYKIRLVSISENIRALILFLDEGIVKGQHFESSAKIYIVSFENNDLSTLSITDGAHIFHERKAFRSQYWRRDYNVNVYDIDGDGKKEIAVQYNHIQRIFKYRKSGEWIKL